MELFGQSLVLADFPRLKAIRGLGISDQPSYARLLADKFDYTNTFYDREPRLDLAESHAALHGMYDFILLADVIEHIAPPIEQALGEAFRLLKPHGFLGITIFCNLQDEMREHFPELNEFRIVPLGKSPVLINRRGDGTLEIRDDLVFHGGAGATLEMREFGGTELGAKLLAAGFLDVHPLMDNLPDIGIVFDRDVSQPLIARKQPFVMEKWARSQMIDEWRSLWGQLSQERERANGLAKQIRSASNSRWVQLGRTFGVGPKFTLPE